MAEDIWYTSGDGLKLYAKSYGPIDAPLTVLCMHGLTRNHKDFEPMIEAMGDRWRFVSVDVRGRGQSAYDPVPKNYTPQKYIGDMAILLDQLQIKKVALIGTSMGGFMSMLMMKAMPERILGTVINDIGPTVEKAGIARIAGYVGGGAPITDWQAAADSVARIQGAAFPDAAPEDWLVFAKRTFTQDEGGKLRLDYDPNIANSFRKPRFAFLIQMALWRLYRVMYAKPLLIVRGGLSDIFSADTAAKMIRRHPDATEIVVPRMGHAPILDEPEAVKAIDAFLRRLEP